MGHRGRCDACDQARSTSDGGVFLSEKAFALLFYPQGHRINQIVRVRRRLSFRSSPDKGVERGIRGTGRLCQGGPPGQAGLAAMEWAFFRSFCRHNPPPPHFPLVRGEAGELTRQGRSHAMALDGYQELGNGGPARFRLEVVALLKETGGFVTADP
jgi:hypothetical protein